MGCDAETKNRWERTVLLCRIMAVYVTAELIFRFILFAVAFVKGIQRGLR